MIAFICRHAVIFPIAGSFCPGCFYKLCILGIRNGSIGDWYVLCGSKHRQITIGSLTRPRTQTGIGKTFQTLGDTLFAVLNQLIDDIFHLLNFEVMPCGAFQFFQLGFLFCQYCIIIFPDLYTQGFFIFFWRIAAIGLNQTLCSLIQLGAFFFNSSTVAELLSSIVRSRGNGYACGGKTQHCKSWMHKCSHCYLHPFIGEFWFIDFSSCQ